MTKAWLLIIVLTISGCRFIEVNLKLNTDFPSIPDSVTGQADLMVENVDGNAVLSWNIPGECQIMQAMWYPQNAGSWQTIATSSTGHYTVQDARWSGSHWYKVQNETIETEYRLYGPNSGITKGENK
jgi:hypothetical protein